MKKIALIIFLISAFSFGQFFDSHQESQENNDMSAEYFSQPSTPEPEQGVDSQPTPGGDDIPIDDWLFLLPLAGVLVGVYYLQRKQKLV